MKKPINILIIKYFKSCVTFDPLAAGRIGVGACFYKGGTPLKSFGRVYWMAMNPIGMR